MAQERARLKPLTRQASSEGLFSLSREEVMTCNCGVYFFSFQFLPICLGPFDVLSSDDEPDPADTSVKDYDETQPVHLDTQIMQNALDAPGSPSQIGPRPKTFAETKRRGKSDSDATIAFGDATKTGLSPIKEVLRLNIAFYCGWFLLICWSRCCCRRAWQSFCSPTRGSDAGSAAIIEIRPQQKERKRRRQNRGEEAYTQKEKG